MMHLCSLQIWCSSAYPILRTKADDIVPPRKKNRLGEVILGHQLLSRKLSAFAEIRYAGALWIREGCGIIELVLARASGPLAS